ncbi:MAG: HAMP domain-containing protein, partial [Verrucomicrobiae bacterium]|nr:HAMP domain-containing protein [Verrucomicrobiae bacterium]
MSGSRRAGVWWHRRSLKLRLALWFTLIAGGLMLALLPVVYSLIRSRLSADMDRQLRIDWDLIEAHLETDGAGGIRWRSSSPATPDSPGYAESWFDVWMEGRNVLRHWPKHGAEVLDAPPAAGKQDPRYYRISLANDQPARTYQKPAVIGGRLVTLRVFRDESGHRATLRRIVSSLALGLPVAVLLAAAGGTLLAGRALRPLGTMAEQARQITSESLAKRLPVANPHDELGQLAGVFNETLGRLEASFESLKRFTADASHELRTPL